MINSVPLAAIFGLVLLLSFGAATAAAETGGKVGVCVVGVDSPCNDPGDTPASDPVANDTPIQCHPDELPYASGLADGDEPVEGDVKAATPRPLFGQLWAFLVQLI